MTPAMQSVQLFLLAAVAFLVIGSFAAAVAARVLRARVTRWEPRARHRALVLLAALPALLSFCLLLSVSLPSLIALVVPGLDHCPMHDDHHAHLCFVHLPKVGINLALLLPLIFGLSYLALRAMLALSATARAMRAVSSLRLTGEHRNDLGITVVETHLPVCFAAGLLRPRVLMSRGLLESLGDEERAVVLAHERAHVRRRDALVASVVRALSVIHLPTVARWLVREVEIAAEQVCDEEAAERVGDRLAVASAILTVERAAQHAAARELDGIAVAFGECAVERRVEALLVEPRPPASLRPFVVALGLAAVGVLAPAGELHHLTESVLSVIAH